MEVRLRDKHGHDITTADAEAGEGRRGRRFVQTTRKSRGEGRVPYTELHRLVRSAVVIGQADCSL